MGMQAGRARRGFRIAGCCTVLLVVMTAGAFAQAPSAEDRYIAARDEAIARFNRAQVPNIDKPATEAEARARAELEAQMRAIVGDLKPEGFGAASFNITSLFDGDIDFGRLDGLLFEADDGNTAMVATTRTLLLRWLKAHENWWKTEALSPTPEAAFRTDAFFTQALNTDAAIQSFAEIPLGVPDARAMLGARTQDATPPSANEIFIAAIRGGRAFVAYADIDEPMVIPACSAARAAAEKKLDAQSDKRLTASEAEKRRDEIGAAFRRCFGEAAPKSRRFAEIVAMAKALYARMPER